MATIYIPNTTVHFVHNSRRYDCFVTIMRAEQELTFRAYSTNNLLTESECFELRAHRNGGSYEWVENNLEDGLMHAIETALKECPELMKYLVEG